jgi:demethylmenaquinone methyltransferase/2-methoxy-6-polyprenyl-1,4-benzoquinol methylase
MAQAVVGTHVREMFASIAGRYDFANSVLSFGIHHLWRRRLLALTPKLPSGAALDLCTGTGDLLAPLSRRFRTVSGLDFCRPMLVAGRSKVAANAVTPVGMIHGDALHLPFADQSWDLLTISFGARNLEQLDAGLREMRRVLRPGGTLIVLEFGQPWVPGFAALYRWYSKHIMPLLGGFVTGNRSAYTYLPQTAAAFPCREDFCCKLGDAGFRDVAYESLTGGIAYLYKGIAG